MCATRASPIARTSASIWAGSAGPGSRTASVVVADQERVGAVEGETARDCRAVTRRTPGATVTASPVARLEIAVEFQRSCVRLSCRCGRVLSIGVGDEEGRGRFDMSAIAVSRPLVGRFIPEEGAARIAALAGFAMLGSLILWASAKISVPFWPVPMTLQTGAVALLAAAYGWRLGLATVVLYLLEGRDRPAGLRGHAAKGIGLAYMVGTDRRLPARLRGRRRAGRLAGRARLRPQPVQALRRHGARRRDRVRARAPLARLGRSAGTSRCSPTASTRSSSAIW